MEYLKVRLRLHWGYSVSLPSTTKTKPSHILPPPTTLLGALSLRRYRGKEEGIPQIPREFRGITATAKFGDGTRTTYMEDIVRNVILLWQRKDRRTDVTYWYGAIPTGRVYSPNGELVAVFLGEGVSSFEEDAWGIQRIGSKEGIVSVEEVEKGKAEPLGKGNYETEYYFPYLMSDSGRMRRRTVEGSFRIENFRFRSWEENRKEGGAEEGGGKGKRRGRRDEPGSRDIPYVLPVVDYPMRTKAVYTEAMEAYRVGEEVIVVR